ncbi:uncharacterized protein LOC108673168 isoform X2 [Hyalella azteca]|uniref:Uncharacterized protein LOC108673168 isoform X2 n=1 Tax=Hyalella azteca TaxID=294128 RepID=A0A979FLL4_HYAAZ|nr:uncharacterized protein LOC108673168 isoform X2 [Hyalella azteca]
MVELQERRSALLRRGQSLSLPHPPHGIRSQEGSGLTIRIPRPLNDRGTSPPRAVSSCSPPAVPRYAQLTTSRYAYMAPLTMPGSAAPVPKSKSLSTSMDKLPYGFHHHMSPSSRGSTPSSGRSSSTAPPSAATSRPPSRRSPSAASALAATHPTAPSCRDKSRSPCGSEVSLNSGVSSSTSVKSLPSVRSNSSASGGRSSVSAARPSPTKASQHQSPTNNAVETVHGSLACRGKVSCGSKVSTAENTSHGRNSNRCSPVYRGANSANNGTKINASKTNGCSKPSIVATHRKNAVVTRPVGIADGCVKAEPSDSVGLSGGEAGSNEFHSPASMPHEPSSSPPTAAPSLPGTNTTPKRRSASCTTAEVSYSPSPTARKMTTMCDANKGQQQSAGVAKKGLPVFNSYMSLFQVQEKLKKGEVIEGVLRINPKNYEDAYISAPGGGTDIYIGGVRDRNAALHGDVVAVELLPSDQWKVLYDQLDYFLDTDETLKSLVYASHDPFAVMDQFVAPGCSASPPAKSTQDETKSADNNETNAAEETASESAVQKKKKKRRGKKKMKQEKPGEDDDMAAAAADVVAALLIDPPPQNVQDELYLLSDGTNKDVNNAASSAVVKSKSNKKKKTTIVVPPDMLSECSDVTDDESCCSDNLDLDTAVEDRSFYNAQRTAINKAIKVANCELGVADRDISGLKPANIVEVQDDGIKVKTEPEIPESIKLEEVPGMKEDAFIKCVQDEDGRLANDNKKRQSTVERLFGDKVKSKTGVKERSLKEDVQEDNVGNVKALISEMSISEIVDAGKTEESESGAKTSALDGTETSDMDSRDSNKPCGFADSGHGFGLVSAPPRFMISPYNQQMNFNHNLSRAENNWMHHPMLNNFSNSPASSQVIMGSQPRHRGQIRPQNQQFKPRQPIHEQQQPLPQPIEKRTVPSVAQVMRLANWSRFVQKIGYVVHILEQRNTRLGAGTLKPFQDLNPNFALFSPNDSRIPRMKIPMSQCPQDLIARRNDYAKRIHLAKITLWTDPKFAMGELISDIGRQGDISAESDAFLLQIGIDTSDFPAEVVAQLPGKEWTIPPEALQGRRDLRDECILTIDPPTARDLDDALSCEPLPNGHFRVGVHIADVSYFVPLDSELDKIAASRATSVYLIDKVISMLPRKLCEDLCSLNPDEDRLTFSVVWEMDPQGQIVSCWFGRSIIRSCAKLSYEHAQKVIDYPEKTTWSHDELPVNARFSSAKVSAIINTLYKLSVEMRARRHHHGALRLDQRKLGFSLDPITKKPNAVHNVEHLASNAMIEEFMLLANISVAHKIYESFPKHAVLRCHPAPQQGQLDDIVNMLRTLNIEIDSSSAGAIYASVLELSGEDSYSLARLEVIVNLLSKPMQNALYFCSGTYEEDFCHYALNVPFYTHFTSPIRRYPDIMVHRLLAAAVDLERYPFPNLELKEIDRRLATANEKKISAKRASDYSAELFLAEFVRQVKEITTNGMVIGVLDRSLDILLLDYCTIKRAYLERLPLDELNYDNKNKLEPPTVHIIWSADHANQVPAQAQSLTYFSCVKVLLTPFTNDQLKFNVTLIRPDS